jgi:hypothetical protein
MFVNGTQEGRVAGKDLTRAWLVAAKIALTRLLREAPVHSATATATVVGRTALFAGLIMVAACTQQASNSGRAPHAVRSPAPHPSAPAVARTPRAPSVAICYSDGSKSFCKWPKDYGVSWPELIQAPLPESLGPA